MSRKGRVKISNAEEKSLKSNQFGAGEVGAGRKNGRRTIPAKGADGHVKLRLPRCRKMTLACAQR
jgi:hypothetical protein